MYKIQAMKIALNYSKGLISIAPALEPNINSKFPLNSALVKGSFK
jgi:hypothetical protein